MARFRPADGLELPPADYGRCRPSPIRARRACPRHRLSLTPAARAAPRPSPRCGNRPFPALSQAATLTALRTSGELQRPSQVDGRHRQRHANGRQSSRRDAGTGTCPTGPHAPPPSVLWPASCPTGPCTAGPCCWAMSHHAGIRTSPPSSASSYVWGNNNGRFDARWAVDLVRSRQRRLPAPQGVRVLLDFLLLDDLGYLSQGAEESEVLFTLIAERYERRSLGITSNLVFSQWEHIFANPMATAAAIVPGGPPLGHPRVRRPQLSHQRRAAAQCTGGEPARIVVVDRQK